MNKFLFDLAERKYRMYHELYKFNSYAYTEDECFRRIKYKSKYIQLLDIIDLLPNKERIEFRNIEKEYFYDAPYL